MRCLSTGEAAAGIGVTLSIDRARAVRRSLTDRESFGHVVSLVAIELFDDVDPV